MRLGACLLACAAALAAIQSQVAEAAIVCWTDEHGRRACGDRVPPEYAKTERTVHDERGNVVQRIEGELSREEQEARAAQAEQARRLAEQRERDRFLLQTYERTEDLEAARDEAVALIDRRIAIAEQRLASIRGHLEQATRQRAALRDQGKPVPEPLARRVEQLSVDEIEAREALERLRAQRAQLVAQYERDIARHRELTAQTAGAR